MPTRESFLVRIWLEEGTEPTSMRGEVEHVRTGHRRRFCGGEELLEILETWTRVTRECSDRDHLPAPSPESSEGAAWSM